MDCGKASASYMFFHSLPKCFYKQSFSDAVYKIIEHTADIGIEAAGSSIEEAFVEAARGMFFIITGISVYTPIIEREVKIENTGDTDILLVDWLSELLYIFDVEHLIFGEIDLKITEKTLTAQIRGEPFDRKKHGSGTEIKAVTYHMLQITTHKKGVTIKVLFDI